MATLLSQYYFQCWTNTACNKRQISYLATTKFRDNVFRLLLYPQMYFYYPSLSHTDRCKEEKLKVFHKSAMLTSSGGGLCMAWHITPWSAFFMLWKVCNASHTVHRCNPWNWRAVSNKWQNIKHVIPNKLLKRSLFKYSVDCWQHRTANINYCCLPKSLTLTLSYAQQWCYAPGDWF